MGESQQFGATVTSIHVTPLSHVTQRGIETVYEMREGLLH
jgi:hypothetical protein